MTDEQKIKALQSILGQGAQIQQINFGDGTQNFYVGKAMDEKSGFACEAEVVDVEVAQESKSSEERADIRIITLSSQDQALLKRILGYVSHGDWQMPATFDNVRAWLSTLFGGDTAGLDEEDVEKTRAFRDFFKGGRAGEDTDRVEVSMANILGYLMSYQLLAGGQKQISTEFFGNDGQVNNINKGKNGEGSQAFKNLIPLMDKYRVRVIV